MNTRVHERPLATRIMVGGTSAYMGDKSVINPAFTVDPESIAVDLSRLNFVAVKVPQFSFSRLGGADPVTGVEMTSHWPRPRSRRATILRPSTSRRPVRSRRRPRPGDQPR